MRNPVETAKLAISRLKVDATKLSLKQCGLCNRDIENLKPILRSLPYITSLDLSENNLFSESIVHILDAMPNLIELDMGSNHLRDNAIPDILKLKLLQKIDLYKNKITEKGAQLLLDDCHCTSIEISHNELSQETEAKIAALAEYNEKIALKRQFGIKNGEYSERTKFIEENWKKHHKSLLDLEDTSFDTTTYMEDNLEVRHSDFTWMNEHDSQRSIDSADSTGSSVTNK